MKENDQRFNPVTDAEIDTLRSIFGERIITSPSELTPYSTDENKQYSETPEVVVFPLSTHEVAETMRLAQALCIPVTPRGSGTSVTGSAVPIRKGIVISFDKMNRILEVDEQNLMVVCEPGVINQDLQIELERRALFYPPDPASIESCTIGGNVALCAGGMRAVKYGVTRDYVTGMQVVLPSGEIMRLGGKLRKNVTGYDLTDLFVGSEGTLGLITEVTLKVLPLPLHRIDLWIPFGDYDAALSILTEVYRSRTIPAVIEFLEKDCIKAWEQLTEERHQFSDAEAHLIIELDGNYPEVLEKESAVIAELSLRNGALDVLAADTPQLRERIWSVRRKISEAMRHAGGKKISEDIVVPPARIRDFMHSMRRIEAETGFWLVGYGHLGDGNVHVNILKGDMEEQKWIRDAGTVIEKIFRAALSYGGTITGEHGIGLTKRDFLPLAVDETRLTVMKKIKQTLDPRGILNPGKIFPQVSLPE